jgi:hypothetical protein
LITSTTTFGKVTGMACEEFNSTTWEPARLLYDFFAFGRSPEAARAKFASYVGLSPTHLTVLS